MVSEQLPQWNENIVHFDKILVIGCIESCQIDNFQCSQRQKKIIKITAFKFQCATEAHKFDVQC